MSAPLLAGAPRLARGQAPAPAAMDEVQQNSEIILQESARMVQMLRAYPVPLNAEQEEALRRFVDLNEAARRFNDVVRAEASAPIRTHDAFQDLWLTYRWARNYFETIHQTAPAAREPAATRQAMLNLIAYYRLSVAPEKTINPANLLEAAANIEARAARLAERAHDEAETGRVSARDAGRIDAVAAAARRFAARVNAERGAPEPLHEDYQALVDALLAARTRLASFTMNTQGEYGALWNLTQSISFLSPEASVGGFAYESRPVYRR